MHEMTVDRHEARSNVPVSDLLERIHRLRCSVWRDVAPRVVEGHSDNRMADAEESTAVHFFAAVGGRVVAAARVTVVADLANLPAPFADLFCEHHGRYPLVSRS